MEVVEGVLYVGIEQVKFGNYLMDIVGVIEDYVKFIGYIIVEEFIGYGVGQVFYEDFYVFNVCCWDLFNVKFKLGMILAIELIVNVGFCFICIFGD